MFQELRAVQCYWNVELEVERAGKVSRSQTLQGCVGQDKELEGHPLESPVGSCMDLMLREGSGLEMVIWNHPYVHGTSSHIDQREREGRFRQMRYDKVTPSA